MVERFDPKKKTNHGKKLVKILKDKIRSTDADEEIIKTVKLL
jgi:hypothetical protein